MTAVEIIAVLFVWGFLIGLVAGIIIFVVYVPAVMIRNEIRMRRFSAKIANNRAEKRLLDAALRNSKETERQQREAARRWAAEDKIHERECAEILGMSVKEYRKWSNDIARSQR